MRYPSKKSIRRFAMATLAVLTSSALTTPSMAEEFTVKMKNKGEAGALVFEPAFLKIAPGDTVTFSPEDKIHNAQSMKSMIPEGGTEWKAAVGADISVTFDVEGVYGYRCNPHYFSGMVGLIVVGDPDSNIVQAMAAKHMGLADKKFKALFEQL